jgi:phospholipid-binding lipoprotein MlaA
MSACASIEGGKTNSQGTVNNLRGALDAGTSSADKGIDSPLEDDFNDDFDDEFEDEFEDQDLPDVFDPLSGYNRAMTVFNDKFYFWLAKPVSKGYSYIVPEPARLSVSRFFKNILFPVRFLNNILQFKFKGAGIELSRFCINSTVGILGLADPAKEWLDLEAYPEDFGQTLGHYGVGGGFHIVLPILGPSNLRDLASMVPDYYADPVQLVQLADADIEELVDVDKDDELALRSYDIINRTSLHIGEYETLRSDALDLYTFLRDTYETNRKKKIEE